MEMMKSSAILVMFMLPLSAAFFLPSSRKSFLKTLSSTSVDLDPKIVESLNGKSAIITGASSGLGKAMSLKLAECDVKQLVISGRNIAALEEVKSSCEEMSDGIKVHILPCDLADLASAEDFAKAAVQACVNKVDMLVLNGGMSSRSSFLDSDLKVDELLMKVNFLSGAAISKQVVPSMVKRKSGSIIWISSVQGKIGTPFRTSYAASKFAVQGYCEALRPELATSGITVHCVSPGYINTNLSKNAATGDGSKHGKLDETTANGADPFNVASQILDSVVRKESDFVVAATLSAKIGIALKLLAPKFLEKKLVKRYVEAAKGK